jgi:hypothetical protein
MPSTEKQRISIPGYDLLIVDDGTDGWQVWLDTEVADFDGLVIGRGRSRVAAVMDAEDTLRKLLQRLLRR